MVDETEAVKIDCIEIKHSRTVSFTVAIVIAAIAFSTGVLAYHYIVKVLPQQPGCIMISVKDIGGKNMQNVGVEIYISITGQEGEKVAEAMTKQSAILCQEGG